MSLSELETSSAPPDPRGWLERHGDYLYRYARSRRADADAAEDLVQETLLAAWRGRREFAGRASERTWLTGILKRKLVDRLRRRVRERVEFRADLGDDSFADALFTRKGFWRVTPAAWGRGDPTGPAERAEFWGVLAACLGKLPPRMRDAFALRYLDGAAGEDVCRDLGITPANFWVLLHRARLRMCHCLTENWYGEPPGGGES